MDLSKFGVEVKNDKPQGVVDSNLDIDFDKIKIDFFAPEVERFLPWFLKYQLKSFDDLIVTKEVAKILDFLKKRPKDKGILLYGAAGCGKTTTLNLIGEHFGYEVFEVNASDSRNKKSIDESVGDVIRQRSLFGKEKLILVDEVDGVSGRDDRGGVAELVKLIKMSSYPLVFTANDIESEKIKPLKKQCVLVDFENSSKELLVGIGKRIFEKENIEFEEGDLHEFVEIRSTNDIRGFINDLQANVLEGKFVLDLSLEIRDYKKKMETLLDKIYFSSPEDSLFSSFNSDVNLDDLFLDLEENCPNVLSKAGLAQVFNEIAKADVFRGRILRWQYWRYLVYVNFYLTYGVSTFKDSPKKALYKRGSHLQVRSVSDKYVRNQRILKKWIYGNKVNAFRGRTKVEKGKDEELKFIEKLARLYGSSVKKCRSRDLFYFAISYKNDEGFREEMDSKLEIDEATKKALMEL